MQLPLSFSQLGQPAPKVRGGSWPLSGYELDAAGVRTRNRSFGREPQRSRKECSHTHNQPEERILLPTPRGCSYRRVRSRQRSEGSRPSGSRSSPPGHSRRRLKAHRRLVSFSGFLSLVAGLIEGNHSTILDMQKYLVNLPSPIAFRPTRGQSVLV